MTLSPELLAHTSEPFDLAASNCGSFLGYAAPPGSKGRLAFERWGSQPWAYRSAQGNIRVDAYARALVDLYGFRPLDLSAPLAWGTFELPGDGVCFCLWSGGNVWARSRSGLMRVQRRRVIALWSFD